MRAIRVLTAAAVAVTVCPVLWAQAEEEPERPFAYSTYWYCDMSEQERADEIYTSLDKPVLDKALQEKKITSYGWLAHHTGGKWRRAGYSTAPTMKALLDAQQWINQQGADDPRNDEFLEICSSHDDYIWQVVAGSPVDDRGKVGFSTYVICDSTKEARADEIVKESFAPVYDEHVEKGTLSSWGWLEHVVGGKYRRLATITAPDLDKLMKAREAIVAELFYSEDSSAGEEFGAICDSHQDYIWEIQVSKP